MAHAYDAEKANKKYDDDTVAYTEEASVVGITERKLGVSLCAHLVLAWDPGRYRLRGGH